MTKQFQYEIQQHQEDCVNNIIQIFDDLNQGKSFTETLSVHHKKNKYPFPIHQNKNIDVMMETGTGKTFTFIQTIFELNKNFGYKKFIILIPTVPIREGTKTNLEDTKNYFKTLYANEKEKEIETFVYEGGNISSVKSFIGTEHLSVLILTPSSFSNKDNILNRPLERELYTPNLFSENTEPPKSYLECLKRLNPIVIMDEPHRFDGDAFKKYFDGFNNYYLRFGATFPKKKESIELSNIAYVLDSISSFRQNLVKKIVVYTQDVAENTDTLTAIDNKKAIVNTLINGIIAKKTLGVGGIFNGKSIRKINKDSLVLNDDNIIKVDYSLSDDTLKSMIRETIKIHFEKEKSLFEKGIKALTLFFIESDTSLFRGENPKIKTFFEEEFIIQQKELIQNLDKVNDFDYLNYLRNGFDIDGNLAIHKGYFSGDKGNSDEKIKTGVDEILKDKKKLLSFESPTRFIFSIWALQEGWDNPNVFTICKLSNQGSEISKLQQIGRGLRICVNQDLKRQTIKELAGNQEEFWKINNLDVVVSNKEQGFVEAIQNEILNNSFFIPDTFTEQELKKVLKEKNNFDDITVRNLFKLLDNKEMILFKQTVDGQDIYEKSTEFSSILKNQDLSKEHFNALESLFATDYKNFIQEKSKIKPKKKVVIKASHLPEFKKLWETISKNADFVIENLNAESEEQLIINIKNEVEKLKIDEILLQTTREEIKVDKIGESDAVYGKVINTESQKIKVDYLEFVRNLSTNTKIPLLFSVKIFNALSNDFKENTLAKNPAQALKEIKEIIRKNLVNLLKAKVRYDGIENSVLPNVFKTENGETYLDTGSVGKFQKDIDQDFSLKTKWVFENVIEYDSDFEIEIIEKDDEMEQIEIFGKLPKLKIKTPLGEYNPDFCYAIKGKNGNKIFLIVESKGYDTSTSIPESEKGKIAFAEKYFEALNDFYQNENVRISFQERIKSSQLASLITMY